MMKVLIALLLVVCLVPPALAVVDNNGSDSSIHNQFGTRERSDCTVFFYGDPINEAARATALGYQVTIGSDLSYANISQYDVVVLPIVGPGTIPGTQADITQFVQEGGGLWINQPSSVGTVDYAPPGFEFYISATTWCGSYSDNTIVDSAHPTMAGLTDAMLPGRFDTVLITDLGAAYTLTARGTNGCETNAHSAAGTYGAGNVFMDVSNWGLSSADPGDDQYVVNVLDWLCGGGPVPADNSSWGSIKALYR
jgi:hypothetical protein